MDPALAHLLVSARSDALRQEFLKAEPASYSTEHDLRIFVATYNLNGAPPDPWPSHLGSNTARFAPEAAATLRHQPVPAVPSWWD